MLHLPSAPGPSAPGPLSSVASTEDGATSDCELDAGSWAAVAVSALGLAPPQPSTQASPTNLVRPTAQSKSQLTRFMGAFRTIQGRALSTLHPKTAIAAENGYDNLHSTVTVLAKLRG